jgi:hypothetical protein
MCWLHRAAKIRRSLAALGLFLVAALGMLPGTAQACSVCLGGDDALAGFTVSWFFLLMMPFAVVGTIGGWLYWMHRRARSREAEERVEHPVLGRPS